MNSKYYDGYGLQNNQSIRAQRYVSLWCRTGSSVMYVPSCSFILLPLCKLNVIFELFVGKLVLISEIVFLS